MKYQACDDKHIPIFGAFETWKHVHEDMMSRCLLDQHGATIFKDGTPIATFDYRDGTVTYETFFTPELIELIKQEETAVGTN